jgi:ribosomal protein L25 (general stress protein Ctc)
MYEIILSPIINNYFSNNLALIEKERIATLGNMQIIIYSNDHNPPHFHVKSKDLTIDAKFKIENCEYISGTITGKEIKIVEKFYNDVKVKMLMKQIWSKK